MKNNNFISATLLASALTLSPTIVSELRATTLSKLNVTLASIASLLHRRGIDENAAIKISKKFINENDEDIFVMLNNLDNGCSIINKSEIMQYISSAALRGERVHLSSYSFLVGMVQGIKKIPLDNKTLKELESIAMRNAIYT